MLKPIDLLVGLKIATSEGEWTQMGLALRLCLSSSQVNAAIKQLLESGLLVQRGGKIRPLFAAMEEFLTCGIKYSFPIKAGELTVGMPTAYAAKPLSQEIHTGKDPIPVWPYGGGKSRGVALEPLHKNVPKALHEFPDANLQELLALIDAVRMGRTRERNLAKKFIKEKLDELSEKENHL